MKRYLFLLILFINLLPRAFNEEWSWQCSSMYAMYGEIPEVTIIPDPKPKPDPPQPTPIPLPLPEPDYPTPPDPGIPSWWKQWVTRRSSYNGRTETRICKENNSSI